MSLPLLEFDAFWEVLLAELELPVVAVVPDTLLRDDLAFDSVLTFELLLVVEDLAGVMLPEQLLGQLVTVGDVYNVYETRVTQG
ncbi:MAG: acyl carrier protein [Actinomycetota bacterium]|nr:acyl carrier protein [Actinomycetota bacterium]